MGKIFMRGLIAIAPIAITIAVLIWLLGFLEDLVSVPMKDLMGEYYFPGLGILAALILIFFVGLIINNFLIQKIYSWGENLMTRIPLVKTLYGAVTDMMSFFNSKDKKEGRVVALEWQGCRMLGLVTRENFEGLPQEVGSGDEVAVYIPLSYQIGGFTIMMPKSMLKPVPISVEEGMRFVVTAGAPGKNAVPKK
ncbi:MAG: DUF502 domain-containing protein [Candidatus Algichlamydia australiensis]|nr:DUF502 domain-containing protein [Chlamydiales bacterium]